MEPRQEYGQSITGAFEGWYTDPADGANRLLLGYFNRNMKEPMDIPIGPDNRIEPGGPDYGQPTHFIPGRGWGIFSIKVPKDFGDKKLTWTIVANGKTTVIPMSLKFEWEVAPFVEATGNTPPYVGFSETGPFVNGPTGQTESKTASVGNPLDLTLWVADDANVVPGMRKPKTPPITLSWNKFRGPGDVVFSKPDPAVEKAEFKAPKTEVTGKATTTATFSEPGDYILHVTANDWTGEGGRGFQCCWTNAYVKVSVSGGPSASR